MKRKVSNESYWRNRPDAGVGPMPNAQLEPILKAELPSLDEYKLKRKAKI